MFFPHAPTVLEMLLYLVCARTLSWFVPPAITEYYTTGWHQQQKGISQSSRGWKSKVMGSAGWVSSEAPLLGLWMVTVCVLTWLFLCVFESLVSCILIFPLKKSLKNVVCLLLAVLDLPSCAWTFSSFSDQGLLCSCGTWASCCRRDDLEGWDGGREGRDRRHVPLWLILVAVWQKSNATL